MAPTCYLERSYTAMDGTTPMYNLIRLEIINDRQRSIHIYNNMVYIYTYIYIYIDASSDISTCATHCSLLATSRCPARCHPPPYHHHHHRTHTHPRNLFFLPFTQSARKQAAATSSARAGPLHQFAHRPRAHYPGAAPRSLARNTQLRLACGAS